MERRRGGDECLPRSSVILLGGTWGKTVREGPGESRAKRGLAAGVSS